jgi:hypothetical protein
VHKCPVMALRVGFLMSAERSLLGGKQTSPEYVKIDAIDPGCVHSQGTHSGHSRAAVSVVYAPSRAAPPPNGDRARAGRI